MSEPISFERLMAYADGELDEQESRTMERRLAEDPALARQLAALREQDAALRSAIRSSDYGPMPETVRSAIMARGGPGGRGWPVRTIFAAAAAALVVAVVAGWTIADYRVEQQLALMDRTRDAEQRLILAKVSEALERKVSGESVTWKEPTRGIEAAVTPLRTFQVDNGQWCREYQRVMTASGVVQSHRAIACREGDGEWIDRTI